MGTWCGDSKSKYRISIKFKSIQFRLTKNTLIAVDKRKYARSFGKRPKDQLCTNIIFYKNVKNHRIVETPVVSLESDMLKIISDQPYKHIYEN